MLKEAIQTLHSQKDLTPQRVFQIKLDHSKHFFAARFAGGVVVDQHGKVGERGERAQHRIGDRVGFRRREPGPPIRH